MIALSPDKSQLIFSVGKTGSTALQQVLTDWQSVGEDNLLYGQWMPNCHVDDLQRPFIDQNETLDELIKYYNPTLTFIVREPISRFASGMKEIVQDYVSAFGQVSFDKLWVDVIDDKDLCTNILQRIYYLGQFPTTEDYRLKYNFDWHRSFSVFHNYHTKNWLSIINQYESNVVDAKNLDTFIESLGKTAIRSNVSKQKELDTIKYAIDKCDVKHIIDRFLQPEIEVYSKINR